MDSLAQKIMRIIENSFMQNKRKKALANFFKNHEITNDFFTFLEKEIMQEAHERKGLFIASQKEWKNTYTTCMKELDNEKKQIDAQLFQTLSGIPAHDTAAKFNAFQAYSIQQTALYQTYQKNIARAGAQLMKRIAQKIANTENAQLIEG